MTRQELKEWLQVNFRKGWAICHKEVYNQIVEDLCKYTPKLDGSYSILTRVYWILHDLDDFPKCKRCGGPILSNVIRSSKKYPEYCSLKCSGRTFGDKIRGVRREDIITVSARKRKERVDSNYRQVDESTVILKCGLEVRGVNRILPGERLHHIVYKMVRRTNGRYYIGHHSTTDPFDEYTGSGVAINRAIAKLGIKEFYKEILFDFDTFEESYDKERELVTPELSSYSNMECYNLKPGGYGGCTKDAGQKAAASRRLHGYVMSDEVKRKIGKANKGVPKSEAHKASLSKHHRSNKWYTIIFEDGREDKRVFGTIPQIMKMLGVTNHLKFRRRSIRGKFLQGIRLKELEGFKSVKWGGRKRPDYLSNKPNKEAT